MRWLFARNIAKDQRIFFAFDDSGRGNRRIAAVWVAHADAHGRKMKTRAVYM